MKRRTFLFRGLAVAVGWAAALATRTGVVASREAARGAAPVPTTPPPSDPSLPLITLIEQDYSAFKIEPVYRIPKYSRLEILDIKADTGISDWSNATPIDLTEEELASTRYMAERRERGHSVLSYPVVFPDHQQRLQREADRLATEVDGLFGPNGF
jgi:hypothetical protein